MSRLFFFAIFPQSLQIDFLHSLLSKLPDLTCHTTEAIKLCQWVWRADVINTETAMLFGQILIYRNDIEWWKSSKCLVNLEFVFGRHQTCQTDWFDRFEGLPILQLLKVGGSARPGVLANPDDRCEIYPFEMFVFDWKYILFFSLQSILLSEFYRLGIIIENTS